MLLICCIVTWVLFNLALMKIANAEKYKRDPVTKKYVWPKTAKEWFGFISAIILGGASGPFLYIMYTEYPEKLTVFFGMSILLIIVVGSFITVFFGKR